MDRAESLIDDMRQLDIQPDRFCYNTILQGLARQQQWEQVMTFSFCDKSNWVHVAAELGLIFDCTPHLLRWMKQLSTGTGHLTDRWLLPWRRLCKF